MFDLAGISVSHGAPRPRPAAAFARRRGADGDPGTQRLRQIDAALLPRAAAPPRYRRDRPAGPPAGELPPARSRPRRRLFAAAAAARGGAHGAGLVRLGRYPWRGALDRRRVEDHAAVDGALAETGAVALADQLADETAGGERQRAWIAMLLAQDAPILLLDEPTSALDLAHAEEVMSLLRRLSRQGRRVIVVLHDINLAARHADWIVALGVGRIAFDGPPSAFLDRAVLGRLTGLEMDLLARPASHPPHAIIA